MDKDKVLDIILSTKVVAVIRMADEKKLPNVVNAVQRGGVRAFEITMTNPFALEVISTMAKRKEQSILVGAGSVIDSETAGAVIHAGADFIVSPITDPEMVKLCKRYGKFVAPGAFTPTEIIKAWELGADVIKIFPATSVGPKYFKDIKGPLPQIELMPTGGVNLNNAKDFISNGACCVAIGTALLDKKAILEEDWDILTQKAQALINSLK